MSYKVSIIESPKMDTAVLLTSIRPGTIFGGILNGVDGSFLRVENGAIGLSTFRLYCPCKDVAYTVASYVDLGQITSEYRK